MNETQETEPAAEPMASGTNRDEAAKFHKAFGPRGAVWYAEGLSFDVARERELTEMRTEIESLKSQNAELQKRLGKSEGETSPVTFNTSEEHKHGGLSGKLRFK